MSEAIIRCTLCGAENTEYIDTKIRNADEISGCKMYRCRNCDTHFMYPLPNSEELEEYYDGSFREEVHTEAYYEDERLTKVFNRFLVEAKTRVKRVEEDLDCKDEILEIGCSVGYFLSAVSEKVNGVYGTEWDSKARSYIERVIDNPKIKVAKNPEDFEKKFDKIFLFHVLEHIENPIIFLKRLKKLLRENGKIYIEVPNVDDILVKTFECKEFMDFYYKKAHIFNYNEKGLKYIFDHSGLISYEINFIHRYDISNHFQWLQHGKPGGKGLYEKVLGDEVNEAYVNALKKAKQTDTLFAIISA
ncbi:methyltransferase family protein [Lachnotalea glycerini]|uniref:Methyltransferase family protein n=1 Tax=Lachnotalea glycerini TaxID=1763509 RepID=A0A318EP14_9FIRM|nr:class I SAM-dependent methyltransferase [Lachnotalea glycerini]OYO87024.1 hypothetical protein CG709_14420 [Lachnotalea glycerini]PXV91859.1 methyltransferase family protein [Lachnotalea glycerini]